MKYTYDTEFLEDGKTIELISIGIVAQDGSQYYAVCSDCDWDRVMQRDWLMENVVPHLPGLAPLRIKDMASAAEGDLWSWSLDTTATCVKPKQVIANEVRDFLLQHGTPELWAYYGAYDHIALAQLFGPMSALPAGIPMFTHEIMQIIDQVGELPDRTDDAVHNALADAWWNMAILTKAGIIG